jgi:Family of unknown function (DUF6152)
MGMNTIRVSLVTAGVLVGALLLTSIPALSHHSFAMYDQTIEREVTGKLVRFVIGANHSQFVFDLVDEHGDVIMKPDGGPEQWQVETGPAVTLARQGITPDSFPIGTIFTVRLNPLRDGRPAGALRGGVILCGKKMPEGGCNESTGETVGD